MEVAPTTLATFFLLRPWILAYDLGAWMWPREYQDCQVCQISMSKIIQFQIYYLDTCTHRTDIAAVAGPLKRWVISKQIEWQFSKQRTFLRSTHCVSMMTMATFSCQIILQKSTTVFWRQPCAAMYLQLPSANCIMNINARSTQTLQHMDTRCHSTRLQLSPLPSNRHHWSNDDCLEGKRENYQVCSVQYCVQQLCTHIWTHLTVLWIGFCLTGPISLCLDSFLYCALLYIVCMRRSVTWWGGPGGIEACP